MCEDHSVYPLCSVLNVMNFFVDGVKVGQLKGT